jgi:para-nitrobenzyl esterase
MPDHDSSSVDRRTWLKTATIAGASAAGLAATTDLNAATTHLAGATTQPAAQVRATSVATPDRAIVATSAGKVRGFTRDGVFVFKGIPYADTTAGANRFLPPQPVKPWTDVRPALAWGPVSPHGPRDGWARQEEQFLYQWDDGFEGEDMLRVNVWTPSTNDSRKRPVLVWLHGGGYASGSDRELRPYDGERLAREHDVVLVSANHRLNVLGFLDLSQIGGERYATSGNVGMLDLVSALEWVRDNIAHFGGDPGNVTIFGQSGGGGKVTTLMGMPSAKGLFHKAVAISGSLFSFGTPDGATKLANGVLTELGIGKDSLDKLHSIPASQLVTAAFAAQAKVAPFAFPKPGSLSLELGWQPLVDGKVLPTRPFDPTAPAESANVPFLVGNTFHEFSPGINNPQAHLMDWAALDKALQPRVGAQTAPVIAEYRKVFPSAKPLEILGLVSADLFRRGAVLQAERKAAQGGAPAYLYWFGWKTPVLDGRPLAYHCQDLAMWFDNIDLAAQATGGVPTARALASKMSGALVTFARTGNPYHPGIPKWPAYSAANPANMIFDEKVEVRMDPDREARRLIAAGATS